MEPAGLKERRGISADWRWRLRTGGRERQFAL